MAIALIHILISVSYVIIKQRASFKAGISASAFRAQREERAISIGKEKRSNKTNSLRKKVIYASGSYIYYECVSNYRMLTRCS